MNEVFVILFFMLLVLVALFYEIGFCNGYEKGIESCEKSVKGESHEEKDN